MVIFKKRSPIPCLEPLFLRDFQIPFRNSAKLLAMHFDQKLIWDNHIKIQMHAIHQHPENYITPLKVATGNSSFNYID